MKTRDTRNLAIKLMKQHGLWRQGWRFSFSEATRRFGGCHYKRQIISISAPISQLNDEARVRNTILHEIAHALAGIKAGHGMDWQLKALDIGCDAKRLYDSTLVAQPPAKYLATCPNCGHVWHARRRNKVACGRCCKKYNGGKYSHKYLVRWSVRAI